MKSIFAKKPEGKEFEIVEPGNYLARCYSMIALGTHVKEFDGKEKKQEKVRITWELPTEIMESGKPFSIGKQYTLSMFESSNLRKDLQSWRGRAFTEEEAESFDITKVLDVPCMINVIHATSKDGSKTYANIASITPLPKGLVAPEKINPTFVFTVDDFTDFTEFSKLPEFIQNQIKESLEYNQNGSIGIVDVTDEDPWANTAIEKLGFKKELTKEQEDEILGDIKF